MHKNNIKIMIGLSSLVIIFFVCLFIYLKTNENHKMSNSNGNILNGGTLIGKDGKIYYSDYSGNKLKVISNGKIDIIKNNTVSYLNLRDNILYYRNDPDMKLYEKNLMNSKETLISNSSCQYVMLIGNELFYTKSIMDKNGVIAKNVIERYSLSSKKSKVLLGEDAMQLNYYNKLIYYINKKDNRVYSIDIDGKNKKIVLSRKVELLLVEDGALYFTAMNSDNKPEMIMLDKSNKEFIISNDNAHSLNYLNKEIYYINKSDGGKLYAIKQNGTNKRMVSGDSCFQVSIFNNKIYYRSLNDKMKLCEIGTDGKGKKIIQ